jgi:hypothetical protein
LLFWHFASLLHGREVIFVYLVCGRKGTLLLSQVAGHAAIVECPGRLERFYATWSCSSAGVVRLRWRV